MADEKSTVSMPSPPSISNEASDKNRSLPSVPSPGSSSPPLTAKATPTPAATATPSAINAGLNPVDVPLKAQADKSSAKFAGTKNCPFWTVNAPGGIVYV